MIIYWPWTTGLAVSLILGGLVTPLFLYVLRRSIGLSYNPRSTPEVPGWLTGSMERFFFTIMVAFDVSGTSTAMIAWIGIKLATNWNRMLDINLHGYAFSALLAGLLSMFFALLGGLICSGKLWGG